MEFQTSIHFTDKVSKRPITSFIVYPVSYQWQDQEYLPVKCLPEEAHAWALYSISLDNCLEIEEWICDLPTRELAYQMKGVMYDISGIKRPYLLTAQVLRDMKPGEEIGTGMILDTRLYNGCVRWVAVRGGGMPDWAVYYHHSTHDISYVRSNGDKCTTEAVIRKLVPCDDEAFALYRK